MGPLQLMAAGGVVLTIGLIVVGKFVNAEGESLRDTAREARSERREMFNMALQQSQRAQDMARMHMQAQMAELEAYEDFDFEGFDEFVGQQTLQTRQYLKDH